MLDSIQITTIIVVLYIVISNSKHAREQRKDRRECKRILEEIKDKLRDK